MTDPDFASFQVFVRPDQAGLILNKDNWPSWIVIRPWEKRSRKPGRQINNLPQDPGPQRIETVIGVPTNRPRTPRGIDPSNSDQGNSISSNSIYCTPENWFDDASDYSYNY